MKILENSSWRKSTGIYRKKQDPRDLMNDFDWGGRTKQRACKHCAFGPKMKRILKIFKKILRFFDQNLYGELTFLTIFY